MCDDLEEVSVVYSELSVSRLIIEKYNIESPIDCRFLNHGINDVYQIHDNSGKRYIFRISPRTSIMGHGEINYKEEMKILQRLKDKGLIVASPIPMKTGELLGKINNKNAIQHYCLLNFIEGKKKPLHKMSIEEAFQIGKTLGDLHNKMENQEVLRYKMNIEFIKDTLPLFEKYYSKNDNYYFLEKMQKEIEIVLEEYTTRFPESYGLIHGDFQRLNIHYSEDRIGIFDFDYLCYGWYLFDLATLIVTEIFFTDKKLDLERQNAIIAGYREYKEISDQELLYLDYFMKFRIIHGISFFLAYYLKSSGFQQVQEPIKNILRILMEWD